MLPNDTRIGGLYIVRLSDTHYYGGRARDFKFRWRSHLRDLRAGHHENPRMQAVYNKYGRFEPEVLRVLSPEEQESAEQEWLDANFRKPGCVNLSPFSVGGCDGRSAETRARMSKTRASRPDLVEKARAQIIKSNKARIGEVRSEGYRRLCPKETRERNRPQNTSRSVQPPTGVEKTRLRRRL